MHIYMNTDTSHKVPMFLEHKINETICFVCKEMLHLTWHKAYGQCSTYESSHHGGGGGEGEGNGSF